jgi:hypothetical protein
MELKASIGRDADVINANMLTELIIQIGGKANVQK